MRILGISGSLRRESWNSKLLRTAGELLPHFVEFEVWDELKAVPPFDEDDELGPAPAAVASLREAVARADAIVFATPEYNASIPGQLKNAIDWLSRPVVSTPLRNKPVVVVGASLSAFGAVWAQAELRKVLATAGAAVGHAPAKFDASGVVVDEELRDQLREALDVLIGEASVAPMALAV